MQLPNRGSTGSSFRRGRGRVRAVAAGCGGARAHARAARRGGPAHRGLGAGVRVRGGAYARVRAEKFGLYISDFSATTGNP